jgi:hypothetical protein
MSQKPIDKRRPLESRDAVWAEIRIQAPHGSFSAREIANATMLGVDTVRDYMVGLCNAGYLAKTSPPMPDSFRAQYYKLEKDCGIEAPRVRRDGTEISQGRGRENMWRTIRILKDFSARDLAVHSSTEEVIVSEEDARCYIHFLHKAGYLKLTSPASAGRVSTSKLARYRFLAAMFTGPKPPQIQRVKQVFDPNRNEVVWKGGANDDAA